ncbi:hypothetical protein BU17DRAFT_70535 [Hysterangium stoloniferum]|nr:hypothetical protein BU17DRAFT_70535 [Hysterangium stoloniferum]
MSPPVVMVLPFGNVPACHTSALIVIKMQNMFFFVVCIQEASKRPARYQLLYHFIMSSRNTVTHGKVRTGSNQGIVAVQLGRRHCDIEDGSMSIRRLLNSDKQKLLEFTIAQLQGLELSHKGGEFEHLFSNWKNVAKGHHRRKYTPGNTTHSQIQASKHHQDWEIQLPLLFEAYMEFKYGGDRIMTDISDASDTAGDIRMEQAQDEFTITVFGLEVMCDLSNINYKPIYRTRFSDALDIYLELHRHMEKLMNESLGRDTPDWHIKHSCPGCLYQLADEPALSPSIIGAVDGNNSLKRFINKTAAEDTLAFESDYFLSRDFVNQFTGEVKVIHRRSKGDKVQEVHEEGDPTGGDPTIVVCTDRWKVANADKTNVLLTSFDETGIFIGACHHGIIWIISDMVKSGELEKYPLATCAYLLEHLPHDIGIGYDIALLVSKPERIL